jgi:ribokinase
MAQAGAPSTGITPTSRAIRPGVRIAVVGHVEWVEFVQVDHVPAAGDIVHGRATREVAAGGGAVAAVQLARWGAESLFFTSFGSDSLGERAHAELRDRGVHLRSSMRTQPQRRAVTLVDAQRERTIIVIGERHIVEAADALGWDELAACDAVYITGGDAGAVRHARRARVVVATSRIVPLLREAAIEIDVLVGSDNDPAERYSPGDLPVAPRVLVRTAGASGGYFVEGTGAPQRYAAVPAAVHGDTYGAGDTFAAALTFAFGEGRAPADAVAFAAARAAEVVGYDGPYPDTSNT